MAIIEIFTENIELPFIDITESKIQSIAAQTLQILGLDNVKVTIIVTDNDYIRSMNREYRGKDYPTDVLSFSNNENPFPVIDTEIKELGDIYISAEKVRDQSREYETTLVEELARLLVHGILHLEGYDHEKSEEDADKMTKTEETILGSLDFS